MEQKHKTATPSSEMRVYQVAFGLRNENNFAARAFAERGKVHI
jgi:hypothetical protein